MNSLLRFLRNEPLHEFHSEEHVDIQNLPSFTLLSNSIARDEQNPIFFIGPWGAGKTVILNSLKNKNKDKYIFVDRNYFGVRGVDEALSHLIGFKWRFTLFIILFVTIIFLSKLTQIYLFLGNDLEKPFIDVFELKGLVGVALIFLFSFVVRPESRLLFLGSLVIQSPFYYLRSRLRKSKTIIMIEDLDRSPLSLSDKFSFLSQLPPLPARYIISYGYNSESEYITLIEYINKLNGIAIEVKQDKIVTFEILKKYINYLPFSESSKWMGEVSVRDLIGCYYSVERKTSGKSEFEKKLSLILDYFDMIKSTKIKYTSGRDNSDLQIIFTGSKFKSENPSISFTRFEGEILNSFFSGIDINYFQNCLTIAVDQKDKDAASNWMEVAWRKIVIDPTYRDLISSKITGSVPSTLSLK